MRGVGGADHRYVIAGAAVALLGLLVGCSSGTDVVANPITPTTSPGRPTTASTAGEPITPDPGKLTGRLHRPDVLITSSKTLPESLVERVRRIKRVESVEPLSVGSMSVEGRTLTVAAVDPVSYRRFTPSSTALANEVWARVAGGEVAVDPTVPKRVVSADDTLPLGDAEGAERVHVGAYATLSKNISAVVNRKRGAQLGLPKNNALLVSTGLFTPSALAKELKAAIGNRASLLILALEFKGLDRRTAVLTGLSVSSAVGSFSYAPGPNGTIRPDARWVAAYIRTEQVPILGSVTCNKAVLPQLRAALQEVLDRGLASKINPRQYAGCYYPRYIGRSAANGLSLHSWGIALDLNVHGNQRGTVGEMDRTVVSIFKKWGFAWGGDWRYTDPMHFEMSRVVSVG